MIKHILWPIFLFSHVALAIDCDCEVRIHSPLTGPHHLPATIIKTYELESFSNYAFKNMRSCRESCREEFYKDMPVNRLNALLINYSKELIDQKVIGYNCTGLTTLKYPVRVRAKLGHLGLGNVVDLIQVVTHEEVCF